MKPRALIVGAGRIAAGWNWPGFPYCYTHADAYLALRERVDLIGFVEPDEARAKAAYEKYGLPVLKSTTEAVAILKPEIVSVCTPDEFHAQTFVECLHEGLKGVWMEKPFEIAHPRENEIGLKIQVNYCRRFDETHQAVAKLVNGKRANLYVWARADSTTECHFYDLARWWGCDMKYMDNTGEQPSTNSYAVDTGKWRMEFRNGGVAGNFMINALANLLDAIEGKAELLSPPL